MPPKREQKEEKIPHITIVFIARDRRTTTQQLGDETNLFVSNVINDLRKFFKTNGYFDEEPNLLFWELDIGVVLTKLSKNIPEIFLDILKKHFPKLNNKYDLRLEVDNKIYANLEPEPIILSPSSEDEDDIRIEKEGFLFDKVSEVVNKADFGDRVTLTNIEWADEWNGSNNKIVLTFDVKDKPKKISPIKSKKPAAKKKAPAKKKKPSPPTSKSPIKLRRNKKAAAKSTPKRKKPATRK